MEFTQEQKLYAKIVQKAWEDTQFKNDLMADPATAVEKLTGHKLNLPEGKTLVVRDQTEENTMYINLPAKQNAEDVELDEEQLEAVAGGTSWLPFISLPIISIMPILTTVPVSPTIEHS